MPSNPIKTGYNFAGWYLDNGIFISPWNFSDAPSTDLTLHAKWMQIASFGISLSPSGNIDFGFIPLGGTVPPAQSITITNNGTQNTGNLTIDISGSNPGSFTLSKAIISDLAVGNSDIFTIVPKDSLARGIHNATVTILGANGIAASFNVEISIGVMSITLGTPTTLIYSNDISNRNALTPLLAPGYTERTAIFTVTVSGFINDSHAYNTGLAIENIPGLEFSGHNAVSNALAGVKTFNITVTLDDTTSTTFTLAPQTITITGLTNQPTDDYILYNGGNRTISINIIDGQNPDKAIPIIQSNIQAFNTYANTTIGLTRHYKLSENIAFIGTTPNWVAIGNDSTNNRFAGSLNGSGYTITNLRLSNSDNNQGMFGAIENIGSTRNLGLVNINISSASYVGGIAGNNYGTIENCYVIGDVSGEMSIGGVVGVNWGTIRNCYATGEVRAGTNASAGGITGINMSSARTENCIAINQSITTLSGILAGRVVGISTGTPGITQNNYAWNNIEVNSNTVSSTNASDNHGADLSATQVRMQGTWTTALFNFGNTNPWRWNGASGMPSLSNSAMQLWPTYIPPASTFTITFDADGGSPAPSSQSVIEGDYATEPSPAPSKSYAAPAGLYMEVPTEYIFSGWYTGATLWNFNNTVNSNITLTAQWSTPPRIESVVANDVVAAINYVNANASAGEYTLLLSNNTTIVQQALNSSNARLTIQGLGGNRSITLSGNGPLFTVGASGRTGINLTLGENITLLGHSGNNNVLLRVQNNAQFTMLNGSSVTGNAPAYADVYVESSAGTFTMSGNASIGRVDLASGSSGITIASPGLTGSIGSLNLRGLDSDMFIVIRDEWQGKQILRPAPGYTLLPTDVTRFNLGDFFNILNVAHQISLTHYISLSSENIGTLLAAQHDAYTMASTFRIATTDVTIPISEAVLDLPVFMRIPTNVNGKKLTIQSANTLQKSIIRRQVSDPGISSGLFIVENGAQLILQDIIIDGNYRDLAAVDPKPVNPGFSNNLASLVRVNGGSLTIGSNAVLRNNRAQEGGAVYVTSGSTLTIDSSALISGNTATSNGGGIYFSGTTFTMAGGEISNNTSTSNSSYSGGGGIYINSGTFTMTGGRISNNTDSSISFNSGGGGVYIYGGTFTMNGGEISNNITNNNSTSYNNGGGGVYVSTGTFNMNAGAIITNNTASATNANNGGGGVIVRSGTFNMNAGAIISSNTTGSNGGGVYIVSTFNMYGGEILGNISNGTSATRGGGGVFNSGTFNMHAGEITANNRVTNNNANGGGIYNDSLNFRLGGTAKIYGNTKTGGTPIDNNLYLAGDNYIVLGDGSSGTGNVPAPAVGMTIHVNSGRPDGIIIPSNAILDHLQYFTSDDPGKNVTIFDNDMIRIW